jgi:mRNA interferase ChpB
MPQPPRKAVPVTIKRKGAGPQRGVASTATRGSGTYSPLAGDIIHLDFTPAAGREMKDPHFALVVSEGEFNRRSGLGWVCPISQGIGLPAMDGPGLAVTLTGTGLKTQGKVHVYQMRAVDLRQRNATFVEKAPPAVLTEVRDGIAAIAGLNDE